MSNKIAAMVAAASTILLISNAWAGPQEDCRAAQGTFLSGTVVSPPRSVPGHERQGVELSHTHIRLLADQDHRTYDVAIDNIFAAGYDRAGHHVPDPLTQIQSNTRVAVCGKLYRDGTGIDWVHTNCGDPPRRQAPDGSIRIIDSAGNLGPNLEDNQEYCSIFR
jgi:hypothetical protein